MASGRHGTRPGRGTGTNGRPESARELQNTTHRASGEPPIRAGDTPRGGADMDWKAGDVVRLRSGGPAMTVEWVKEKHGEACVSCSWFDGSEKVHADFHPAALMAVDFKLAAPAAG